jgi:mRNA interferase MazF
MNYKIILVPFPFDDLSFSKIRPAVCLSNKIGKYNHLVIAFSTSRISEENLFTDIKIIISSSNGLKTTSTIRLQRMTSIPLELIQRQLGVLSKSDSDTVNSCFKKLFELT